MTAKTDVDLAPVVQKVDNAIHGINHYPEERVVCFVKIYPVDSATQPLNHRGLLYTVFV